MGLPWGFPILEYTAKLYTVECTNSAKLYTGTVMYIIIIIITISS